VAEVIVMREAVRELEHAEDAIIDFFVSIQDIDKGVEWAAKFIKEFNDTATSLEEDPERFPLCQLYPFNEIEGEYRYFRVMWFTVFYEVDNDTVKIRHVVSSKSDFSRFAH